MNRRTGTILVVVSAAAFGAMPIFARYAYADGVDPVTLLAARFTAASALLWAIVAARRLALPRGRTLLALVAMGAVLYVAQAFAYFTAITMAPAGLVSLLLYLFPAIVTVAAVAFLGERLTKVKVVSLCLALAGTAVTIGPAGGGARPLGIALGVASAVIYATYILVGSRVTARAGAIPSVVVIVTSAAVVYAAIAVVRGPAFPASARGWAAIAAMGFVSTVVSSVALFEGMKRVGPATASTLSTVEPALTVALEAVLFGVPVTWYLGVGGALILVAVILLARAPEPAGVAPRGVVPDAPFDERAAAGGPEAP